MAFKQIASFDNYMLANITLGMLEENYINCHLKDENIVTINPLLNPAVGGIKLMVEESQAERAVSLIKEAEAAYLNEIICPYCKQAGLVAEEEINNPQSFWGKLKNQVAYGQTSTYSKKYRCQHCKSLMDELPASF
ncbi:putative signal transducing protein [Ferruginibacter sp.]